MTHITDMCGDPQPEKSGWQFTSPLAVGGGILWQPHYWLHICDIYLINTKYLP